MSADLELARGEPKAGEVWHLVLALCHDMRQPLATIVALSSTAAAKADVDAGSALALGRITEQATGLLGMIRSTLDVRTGPPCVEPAFVPAVLADVVAEQRETYSGTLTTRVRHTQRATVQIHPSMLRRAIANLVDNATRAAGPTGAVKVTVIGGGAVVDIIVQDDGPGFGKIASGFGIGLDVVRRVAAACDGQLDIRANEAGGVQARLRLSTMPPGGCQEDEDRSL
jgi:signal transduction histidine kinase